MQRIFLVVFLVVGLSFPCWAGSKVTFEWNPNSESDLAGYRLYQTDVSGEYTFDEGHRVAIIPAGTETVTLDNIPDGAWFWVLTAYDTANNESKRSNEVTAILDTEAPGIPTLLKIQSWSRKILIE